MTDHETIADILRASGHADAARIVAALPAATAPTEPEPPAQPQQPVVPLNRAQAQQQADAAFLDQLRTASQGDWTAIPLTDLDPGR